MDQMKRKKETLELKAREIEKRRRAYHRQIGEKLYGLPPGQDEPPQCAALREAILAGEEELRKNEELRKDLKRLVEEAEEQERLQKERRQDLRDMEKDNLGLYEKIGRAGFQAHREGTLQGEELDTLFAPLIEQKEKINTYEVELKGKNSSGGTLFNKIARGSRHVLLKGNQSLGLRSMTKAYQKTGEALSLIENLSCQGIEPLEGAFATLLQNKGAQKTLEEALAKGEARATELAEALKSRDALRLPRRRIANLEKEGENLSQKRQALITDFGAACASSTQTAKSLPEELIALGKTLSEEDLEIQEDQARLERARRRNELTEGLKKLQQERARVEKAMKDRQRELENLEEEIRRITGEREALEEEDRS